MCLLLLLLPCPLCPFPPVLRAADSNIICASICLAAWLPGCLAAWLPAGPARRSLARHQLGFNDPNILHQLTFGARTNDKKWGNAGYQDFFAGALDDLRLFNVEVSSATVAQIYKQSSKVMCDASALSGLMNGVNHMCCDDPDYPVDCSNGLPPTCSVDCAQVGPRLRCVACPVLSCPVLLSNLPRLCLAL
eukprot:SAG22_NODE_5443_length_1013_cov_1.072210_2_plen_191_part_00